MSLAHFFTKICGIVGSFMFSSQLKFGDSLKDIRVMKNGLDLLYCHAQFGWAGTLHTAHCTLNSKVVNVILPTSRLNSKTNLILLDMGRFVVVHKAPTFNFSLCTTRCHDHEIMKLKLQ